MTFAERMNYLYWRTYNAVTLGAREEDGAEVIEWVALVAVLVLLVAFLYTAVNSKGKDLSTKVVTDLITFVGNVFDNLKGGTVAAP